METRHTTMDENSHAKNLHMNFEFFDWHTTTQGTPACQNYELIHFDRDTESLHVLVLP